MHTFPCVKQRACGNLLYVTESSNLVLSDSLDGGDGGDGWEVGGRFREREHMSTCC